MTKQKLTKVLIKLFLIFPLLLNAQKYTKSNEPFTASNGKVYHIGDTIIITSPADFDNTFVYFKTGKKLQTPQVGVWTSSDNKTYNKMYTKYIIKQFRHYEAHGVYAVVNKKFNYAINLDKGLEFGEIATDKLMELYNKPEAFTAEKAFLITLGDDFDNNDIKEYLYRFYNKEYKQSYQDEFSFNELISKKRKELTAKSSQYRVNQVFYTRIDQEFGNYNFDTNSFPIIWEGNGGKIINDLTGWVKAKDINNEGISFSDIRLHFDNIADFSSFTFPQERAKYLVQHRKQPSGKIDRRLYMGVQFDVKEVVGSEDLQSLGSVSGNEKVLICEIKRIDLFEDEKFEINYLQTIEN